MCEHLSAEIDSHDTYIKFIGFHKTINIHVHNRAKWFIYDKFHFLKKYKFCSWKGMHLQQSLDDMFITVQ
jgi:hypothetical protein